MSKEQDKSPQNKEDQPGYEAGQVEQDFDRASITADAPKGEAQPASGEASSEEGRFHVDDETPRGLKDLAENPDSWPLQADRMAIHLPLIDC